MVIDGEVVVGVRECMWQNVGVGDGTEGVNRENFFPPFPLPSSTKYIQNVVVSPKNVCMYNRI
jgi:hypothetical protein